jgi:hypothetical protein
MNAPIDYRFTYRAQLDRVRRMRARFDEKYESMEAAQDIMWSFFQHCWHLKDWVMHDAVSITQAQKDAIYTAVHAPGSPLRHCQGLCNATKHLETRPGEARHSHMNANLGGGRPRIECIIDDGTGQKVPGHNLADQCIAEWDRILTANGLSVDPSP